MKTFKQFLEQLTEGKHEYIGDHKLGPDSPEEYIKQALEHPHAGVAAYGVRHYNPEKHPNLSSEFDAASKHPDWWVRAETARNPHLTPEQKERLSTDKNSKVRNAAGGTAGSSSAAPAKAKAPSTPKQKPATPKPAKTPSAPKGKASPGIKVVSANPEDHGLPDSAKVSHVHKDGKPIATAISSLRPGFGELDQDKIVHQAFVGNHTSEEGLRHVGDFKSHQEALIAAAKASKNK